MDLKAECQPSQVKALLHQDEKKAESVSLLVLEKKKFII
tara:strand:- start:2288 stop:2404 length:117 start_codon:yes stop_codon:yes gene_type:complete